MVSSKSVLTAASKAKKHLHIVSSKKSAQDGKERERGREFLDSISSTAGRGRNSKTFLHQFIC